MQPRLRQDISDRIVAITKASAWRLRQKLRKESGENRPLNSDSTLPDEHGGGDVW
jgi:hypothetical protein